MESADEKRAAFSRRLNKICDDSQDIPDLHKGRYERIIDLFRTFHGIEIRKQVVARWFTGQAIPSRERMSALASILGADEIYLTLGISELKNNSPSAVVTGYAALNLIAGFLQIEGVPVEFINEDECPLLIATLNNKKMRIIAANLLAYSPRTLIAHIPTGYKKPGSVVIGLKATEGLCVDAVVIPIPLIVATGDVTGATVEIELTLDESGYSVAGTRLKRIDRFSSDIQ